MFADDTVQCTDPPVRTVIDLQGQLLTGLDGATSNGCLHAGAARLARVVPSLPYGGIGPTVRSSRGSWGSRYLSWRNAGRSRAPRPRRQPWPPIRWPVREGMRGARGHQWT